MTPKDEFEISRRAFVGACVGIPLAASGAFGLMGDSALASEPSPGIGVAANPNAAADLNELLKHVDPALIYRRPPADPAQDGWQLWEEAGRQYVHYDANQLQARVTLGMASLFDNGIFPQGRVGRAMRRWLVQNEKALSLVNQGIARGAIHYPRSSDALKFELLTDYLTVHRNLARLKVVNSACAAADGDFASAIDEAADVLVMGRMRTGGECLFVDYVTGLSITGMGVVAIRRITTMAGASDSHLAECIEKLQANLPRIEDVQRAYQIEFSRYFVPEIAEYPVDTDLRTLVRFNLLRTGLNASPPNNEFLVEFNRYIDTVVELLKGHPQPFDKVGTVKLATAIQSESLQGASHPANADDHAHIDALAAELRDWPAGVEHDISLMIGLEGEPQTAVTPDALAAAREKLKLVSNPLGKRLLLQTFGVHYWKAMKLARARVNAVILQTAILLYIRRHKQQLPESLEALVDSGLLPAVPVDPFADHPFQYDSQRGVIWSVGHDGQNKGESAGDDPDALTYTWLVKR